MAQGFGKSITCDNCDCTLQDYHGASMPGQCTCYSSVYGADNVLCVKCSTWEEDMIDEEGTNDLPALKQQYERNKRFFEQDCDQIV